MHYKWGFFAKKLIVLESDFSINETGDNNRDETDVKFGFSDAASGIYEIQEQKLIKTHYYDIYAKKMKPIIYAGNLGVGMVVRDIYDIYNYGTIELRETPQWVYGYDSEELGYELWVSEKLLYFLIIPDFYSDIRRIEYLTVISPDIFIKGLHTGMTVEDILQQYPKAVLNIDDLNDWEYIYIPELKIILEFQSEKHNRIAQYKLNEKDGSLNAIKILDKTRKVDFITVSK